LSARTTAGWHLTFDVRPTNKDSCRMNAQTAAASSCPLPRVVPPGPVSALGGEAELDSWLAPRISRCRRQRRPWSLLQVVATPVTPAAGVLDPALRSQLLAACAHRLRANVRATDQVARIGLQEIVVLLDGAGPAGAQAAAARLVRVCQGPYRIDTHRLELCVTVTLERESTTSAPHNLPSPLPGSGVSASARPGVITPSATPL
jgi:GGDEF domain-containing protein